MAPWSSAWRTSCSWSRPTWGRWPAACGPVAAATPGAIRPSRSRPPPVRRRRQLRRETAMSDHDEDDWGNLPFEILAVHEGKTPAREPPFHAEGGEWLFLECRAGDENPAPFTVGVLTRGKDDRPMVWGKAWLAVVDREAGARLVRLFADAFFEDEPPPAQLRRPLEPLLVRTANLDDLRRHLGDEGVPPPDAWSSTKWFLELGRFSAEVYFNYNLGL